jgi:hypothetical protein
MKILFSEFSPKPRVLLLALCLFGVFGTVFADDYHYINLFVGDRASGLAGAYTAIADGPEGAYYNPAGLAFSPSVYVSVSTNAVQLKQLVYKDIWASVQSGIDYVRNSFAYVPTFFGTVQRDGKLGFALTLATIENDSFDQRDKLVLYEPAYQANQIVNIGFIQSNNNQELGLSWGLLLSDSLSLGWGAFLGYRESKLITENVQQLEGYAFFNTQTSYFRRQKLSIRPSLGLQMVPFENASIGLSGTISIPLLAFDSAASTSYLMVADGWVDGSTLLYPIQLGVQDNSESMLSIVQHGLFASTYAQANLGFAYFLSPSLLVSIDGTVYVPLNSSQDGLQRVFTWNAAAGLEWYLSPNFPLRVGLFTNNANTPSLSPGNSFTQDHLDLYGASLSFGYATSNFDLTLGAAASIGWGDSRILSGNQAIQSMNGSTVQLFISGSFH